MAFTKEQQAEIDAMIEAATDGLTKKRDELLAEVKALRKGKTIDPAEIEKLEAERDDLKAKLAASEKSIKNLTKEADTAKSALAAESGFTSSLLIDQGLTAELTANGVTNPALLKAASALLKSQGAQIVVDGDKRVAKLGDKALPEAVKAFAATDEGKNFVTAKQSSGGGATGGVHQGSAGKTMTRTAFNQMDPAAKSAFAKEGGKLTDAA